MNDTQEDKKKLITFAQLTRLYTSVEWYEKFTEEVERFLTQEEEGSGNEE
jgi:hypothetical protein